jgi:hydroxyacylglutathione hydrolase
MHPATHPNGPGAGHERGVAPTSGRIGPVLFRQLIHEDLGCASYLIGDSRAGIAAVVDPQWDIDPYLRLSRLHGVHIEHVLETHNHADHVSGHGRLSRATGATIHVHELAEVSFPHEPFTDGWTLRLGDIEVEAAHTPGHRPEHTSFVLRDTARGEDPWAVLTGDSLFVGDVARPDLAIEPREGAADIFRSLNDRLFSLPRSVEVWPGHLGGSLCGGSGIDHKSSSTIGFELDHNNVTRFDGVEEFVEEAVATLGDRPPNVEHIVALNRGALIEALATPAPMTPRGVETAIAEGAILVDSRTNQQFDEAHIPGAISASAYDTGFGTKVAQVVAPAADVVVVAASDGYELEAAELLASVGLSVKGFLEGGMTAWRSEGQPVSRIEMVDPAGLAERLAAGTEIAVLDVRDDDEFAAGHIPGSLHIPYAQLGDRLAELPNDRPIAAICSGGKRSGLAASILQREGFDGVLHVADGGVAAWQRAGHPVE